MRVAWNDLDDRARLRGYVEFNKYTYIHTYIHTEVFETSIIDPPLGRSMRVA